MRVVLGLALIAACGGSKTSTPAPALDAAAVVSSPPPDAAMPMTVPLGSDTLGEFALARRSNGGGTGPGVSFEASTLTVRRGTEEVKVELSESNGSSFGDYDLDAEFTAFDRLFVIEAGERYTITLMPGAAPAPLDDAAAIALIDAEVASQGRRRAPKRKLGYTGGARSNPGVMIRRELDGDQTLWTAEVGLYTRHVTITSGAVRPAPTRGGVVLGDHAKLPGGVRATRTEHELVLTKGKEKVVVLLLHWPFDAEIVAFGKLYVVETHDDEERIVPMPGKVPARLESDAVNAAIEAAVDRSGFPPAPWQAYLAAPALGVGADDTNITKITVPGGFVARVGLYTGRVWLTDLGA